MSLNEHIESVKIAVQRLDEYGLAESMDPVSDLRMDRTAILSIKLTLIDKSELYIRQYLHGHIGVEIVSYSYQYQSANKTLIFRYDNSKHKPALGFDEHKHLRDGSIIPSALPSIDEIIDEVIACFG
jgi:Family of unknown function (DUF6516)